MRVLVPGAGLGRLAWEVVRNGAVPPSWQPSLGHAHRVSAPTRLLLSSQRVFAAHGQSDSYFPMYDVDLTSVYLQLIASAFILNHAPEPNSIPLYPYLHSISNIRSRQDLLAPCWIPDVNPNEIAGGAADFSFAAGDFLEVYGDTPGMLLRPICASPRQRTDSIFLVPQAPGMSASPASSWIRRGISSSTSRRSIPCSNREDSGSTAVSHMSPIMYHPITLTYVHCQVRRCGTLRTTATRLLSS